MHSLQNVKRAIRRRIPFGLLILFAYPFNALAETRTYDLSDFSEISVAAGIKADIQFDENYSVVADTTEYEMKLLDVRMKGKTLFITRETPNGVWINRDPVIMTIELPKLDAIAVSSGARAMTSDVDAGDFEIEVTSGASLTVSGVCDTLDIDVSSGATASAQKLRCNSVSAKASSGAFADVFADEEISARSSSGSQIRVRGNPSVVEKRTSSGGAITVR